MFDETFWVAVSFVLFFAIVFYLKVPSKIVAGLDARASRIRNELDEARRLREEAQGLLATYQRKRQDAEKEAQDIVTQAKSEAEAASKRAQEALEARIERRLKSVEEKIAQAEADAIRDVRNSAATLAVNAARRVISEELDDKARGKLVTDAISGLKGRFH
ncbi:F0F1 ATP synthase subunit B [Futiania mangrovi]|uniref:ATP synthase subunit b n=1 Tax=Futiania mangrovi TaxID=2959716 RepID=A0A9J6PGJ0_9PROT|nr:F0F1 ATP synthase subunit B [Futiania mangrovii]MCP1337590.1 F0F1 ATP synthase subunit B [Futiania mangrovii]